jgi:hypothetical protein
MTLRTSPESVRTRISRRARAAPKCSGCSGHASDRWRSGVALVGVDVAVELLRGEGVPAVSYESSSSTLSGGRASTARSPRTTMGR